MASTSAREMRQSGDGKILAIIFYRHGERASTAIELNFSYRKCLFPFDGICGVCGTMMAMDYDSGGSVLSLILSFMAFMGFHNVKDNTETACWRHLEERFSFKVMPSKK